MREILFRGKEIYTNEWHEGFLYIGISGACEILETHEYFAVIPETVGQYTGLVDKNGKKIFEGDIVRIIERGATINAEVAFINKYAGGWVIRSKNDSTASLCMRQDIEVIGNIHDNPELLER